MIRLLICIPLFFCVRFVASNACTFGVKYLCTGFLQAARVRFNVEHCVCFICGRVIAMLSQKHLTISVNTCVIW